MYAKYKIKNLFLLILLLSLIIINENVALAGLEPGEDVYIGKIVNHTTEQSDTIPKNKLEYEEDGLSGILQLKNVNTERVPTGTETVPVYKQFSDYLTNTITTTYDESGNIINIDYTLGNSDNNKNVQIEDDGYTGIVSKVEGTAEAITPLETIEYHTNGIPKLTMITYRALYEGTLQKDITQTIYDDRYTGHFTGPIYTPELKEINFGEPQNGENIGEPVNIITGNYYASIIDIQIENLGPDIKITRAYNSLNDEIGVLGIGWTLNYDSKLIINGDVVTIYYTDGRKVRFIKDINGKYVAPDTIDESFTFNGSDYILTFKSKEQYIYNTQGKLVKIIDKNNNAITLSYDGNGNLLRVAGQGGSLDFVYVNNKLTKVTDHTGRYIEYSYEGNDLKQVKNLGGTITYTYNQHGITTIKDEKGITYINNVYDEFGRIIEQTDEQSRLTLYDYSESKRQNTYTVDGTNTKIIYNYDINMYIIKKTWEDGTYEEYTYDDNGNKTDVRDRRGNVTHYDYDDRNNIVRIISPAPYNYETVYTYDDNDNVTTITTPDGGFLEFIYDSNSNLETIRQKIDATTYAETKYTYDSYGRVLTIKDPEGNIKTYEYDPGKKKPTKEIGAEGEVISYQYDSLERVEKIITSYGETTIQYNQNNRIEKIIDPNGNITRMFYDGVGNLIKQVLPEQYNPETDDGQGYKFSYDGMDRLIMQIDPLGNVYKSFYDQEGHKLKDVNPNYYNSTTGDGTGYSYEYDGSGRLTKVIAPSGEQRRIVYDGNGNITKVISANNYNEANDTGDGNTYHYDELNRLIQVNDANGTPLRRYVYDEVGRVIKDIDADGIKSGVTDSERFGTLYSYNLAGWLVEKRTPVTIDGGNILYNITQYEYNKNGQLMAEKISPEYVTSTSLPSTYNIISYAYDKSGRIISISDTTGADIGYKYDDLGRVIQQTIKISDNVQNITGYAYDAAGRLEKQWVEIDGYDLDGSFSGTVNAETTYEYDKNGNVTKVTSPEGYVTEYTYDESNRLVTIKEQVEESTLNQNRNTIKISSPYLDAYPGQTYTYEVELDTEDTVQSISAMLGYDPRIMEVVNVTSNNPEVNIDTTTIGNITITGNNINSTNAVLCSLQIRIKELVEGTSYIQFTKLPTYTTGGQDKTFTEAIGKSVKVTDPDLNKDGNVEANDLTLEALEIGIELPDKTFNYSHDFDPNGIINSHDLDYIKDWLFNDTSSQVQEIIPDYIQPKLTNHDYTTTTNTVTKITTFEYDKAGNVTKEIDTNGNSISYEYDANNRLIKVTDKEKNTSRFKYDKNNNIIKQISAKNYDSQTDDGPGIVYTYDVNNRLTSITNEENKVVQTRVYDDKGQVVQIKDVNNYITTYTYDIGGRVITISSPKMKDKSEEVSYTYDALGNVLTITYAEDNTTTYIRDLWGRATAVTNAKGITEYYTYDAAGNIISSTDGNNHTTTYTYNSLNKIKLIKDPQGNNITYYYDKEGRLTKELDREGRELSYSYNYDNNLVSKSNNTTGETENYLYNRDGSLLAAINNNAIKAYTPNGYVDTITNNKQLELSYGYDQNGMITSVKDLTGKTTNYTYDILNRLDTVTSDGKTIASYNYNSDSTLYSITYGNGMITTYGYDKDKNIESLITKNGENTLEQYTYQYDLNGNLTKETKNGQATTYMYDATNQLETIIYPGNKFETFIYDNAGNRIQREIGGEITDYSYNSLNQLTSLKTNDIITTYNYDKNGNLISETTGQESITYTYDGFNRLTKVVQADGKWMTNTYDALGIRINVVENGISTDFTVD